MKATAPLSFSLPMPAGSGRLLEYPLPVRRLANHPEITTRKLPDDASQSRMKGERVAMPETAPSAPPPSPPILTQAAVERRMLLLAELQDALTDLGVRSVLARNHRLVLQYNRGPSGPSGLTEPQLYIFASEGIDIATTDGSTYNLAS